MCGIPCGKESECEKGKMASSSEIKVKFDKLQGPDDWAKWKWQTNLILRAHGLEGVVDGSRDAPQITPESTSEEKRNQDLWRRDDAKASSLIATGLSKPIAELVLTCGSAREIWSELCARFEWSNAQRLNMLIEAFFQAKKVETDEISQHIARLQKLFTDLNSELSKNNENSLSERMLVGRIPSTLGKDFNNFKDLWDTITAKDQTLNLLIEKLCAIEMRELHSERAPATGAAFVVQKENATQNKSVPKDKKKFKKDPKQRYPCRKCKELGHWAAECPKRTSEGKKKNTPVSSFMVQSLEASAHALDASKWYCDSGATTHISPDLFQFESFESFQEPEKISLGRKGAVMFAIGKGHVRVHTKIDGNPRDIILKNVLYVPEASANLLSVKAVAGSGHSTTFSKNGMTVHETLSGTIVATGRPHCGLFALDFEVLKPADKVEVVMPAVSLQQYHERLGHQDKQHVKQLLRRMNIETAYSADQFCDGCALGKMHRLPYRSRTDRAKTVGEVVHTDVNGPMQTTSIGGARYYVCFKDDYSRYRRLFSIDRKTGERIKECMEEFLNEARTKGHVIRQLRSDSGKEYVNKEVAELLAVKGIEHVKTPPYSPELCGSAERENRTIVEAARAMLKSSGLSTEFWAEACNTASFLLNRTGKSAVADKTPYELWNGKPFGGIEHLRIFGTECYVHIPKQQRKKLDSKAHRGIMLGYANDRDGYRVWVPELRKTIESHDVVFKPEKMCANHATCPEEDVTGVEGKELDEKSVGADIKETQTVSYRVEGTTTGSGAVAPSCVGLIPLQVLTKELQPPLPTCTVLNCNAGETPETFAQAMETVEKDQWTIAIRSELASLEENETWELVERPKGVKIIGTRWVLRKKEKPDGSIRFKARLVAKGYAQQKGIDYNETFSPVARYDTVRVLLALIACSGLRLAQFDVTTAFLYGYLPEEEKIYVEQPEGLEDKTGRVYKLKRGLYGLRQAPRCWCKRFFDFMRKQDLQNSSADPYLFFRNREGN